MGANVNQTKPSRLRRWFSKKQYQDKREHSLEEFFSVEDQYGFDDSMDEFSARSLESNPCTMTANLRVFLGTWNVGGRFPVGSMDVDLEEWLNLKDEADIYVLGFQEIVPLKARTVMGVEHHNLATSWNLLIGQALNQKHGYTWFTPRFEPNLDDEDHKVSILNCVGRNHFSDLDVMPGRGRCRKWHQKAKGNDKYMLIASKKMVGVFISVWMKKELLRKYRVSNVKVCSVPCGIMGYLGNKGSVSVSLSIEGTSFCFVVAHLASGEKKGDINRRNHQVSEIIRRTLFPRNPKEVDDAHPVSILGHDQIFWFGDLNYRLCLEDGQARQLIKKQDWKALQAFDQLGREQQDGVFQGWHEGNIEFAPTYKYSASNCDRYSGSFPSRAWEKQRTPAWCDRILWFGKGIKQLSYLRGESKFSDHRPVYALFSTEIEVHSHSSEVIPFNAIHPTIVPPRLVRRGGNEEGETNVLSFMEETLETNSESTDVNITENRRWMENDEVLRIFTR